MKLKTLLLPLMIAGSLFAAVEAHATQIYTVGVPGAIDGSGNPVYSTALTAADTTMLSRPSRSGTAQSWDTPPAEAYTGVINATTSYYYRTYSFASMGASFLEITFDSRSLNTFLSAYLTTYTPGPAGSGATWLGDAGGSGPYNFGGVAFDVRSFQVQVPAFSTVVLMVNNTGAGGLGLGDGFNIDVKGYTDTMYSDVPTTSAPGQVPEPATLLLLAGPLAGLALKRRKAQPARVESIELACAE